MTPLVLQWASGKQTKKAFILIGLSDSTPAPRTVTATVQTVTVCVLHESPESHKGMALAGFL